MIDSLNFEKLLIGIIATTGSIYKSGEFGALHASFQLSLLLHKSMAGCIRMKKGLGR